MSSFQNFITNHKDFLSKNYCNLFHFTPDVEGCEKSETSISGNLILPLLGRQTISSGSTSEYEDDARSDGSVPVISSWSGLNSGAGEWLFSLLLLLLLDTWLRLVSLSLRLLDECVPFSSSLLPSVYNSSSEIQCSSSS